VDITRHTIPGVGHSYDCHPRDGQQFGVLVEYTGRRTLLVYEPDGEHVQQIVLAPDEADQVADLLHQRSVADRLADLERRVARLVKGRA